MKLPGINIQYPISRLILSGEKTVETRHYAISAAYQGRDLWLVETPGPEGKFKARVIAKICFGRCWKYESREAFYRDLSRHKVSPDSPWAWRSRPKWAWEIESVAPVILPFYAAKIGRVYTREIEAPRTA